MTLPPSRFTPHASLPEPPVPDVPEADGVVVAVEDLDLIAAHEKDAAVAAALALPAHLRRRRPLQVQLAVAEFFARLDVARAGDDLHVTVRDLPARLAAIHAAPAGEIGAV